MKKRQRKKLHKGEFQQFGISLFVPSDGSNVQESLGVITDIADKNAILFIGGGFGYFVMPSEEYNNLDIPKKIVDLATFIVSNHEQPFDGIIGYFINPFKNEITKDVAEKVKSELETALNAELKINLRIDLWN